MRAVRGLRPPSKQLAEMLLMVATMQATYWASLALLDIWYWQIVLLLALTAPCFYTLKWTSVRLLGWKYPNTLKAGAPQ